MTAEQTDRYRRMTEAITATFTDDEMTEFLRDVLPGLVNLPPDEKAAGVMKFWEKTRGIK